MVYFCIYYTSYIRIYAIGNLIILRENETITGLWGFGVSNSRNQITTISKIRISDPKTSGNVLSGIKISSEMLDKLDKALSDQFLNKNKKK
jgi:hypothetical protein